MQFSRDELREALQLLMAPEDAASLASDLIDFNPSEATSFIGHGFTGDTLILLSFVSSELRDRVEALVRSIDGSLAPEYVQRRSELGQQLRSAGRIPAE